ncbi:hypothetical protein ACSAZK_05890 [Methanosarcina sp. Mfa9]|uniref:hypothetical protein n=1 Tax=Methanosarcina sp. Mfa9 TaxID=3439063 RepID=UPI003F830873
MSFERRNLKEKLKGSLKEIEKEYKKAVQIKCLEFRCRIWDNGTAYFCRETLPKEIINTLNKRKYQST